MIQFNCPGCQASYTVSDERAGKTGKCPKCQTSFTVPPPTRNAPPARPPKPVLEDERPRTRAPRQEEVPDDEERPRAKRRQRDDEVREDERPRKAHKAKEPRSSLEGAMRMIRRGQLLDLLTVFVWLGVVVGLYFGVVAVAKNKVDDFIAEQTKAWDQFNAGWGRPGWPGPWPPILEKRPPEPREIIFEIISNNAAFRILPALPAFLLLVAGLYVTVGRIRLAAAATGSGGARVFAATAFIAIGRLLIGLAATALVVWLTIDATTLSAAPDSDGVNSLLALGLAFPVAFYLGVLGEVLSLPGLALAGWFQRTTDRQRGRIGTVAAFYPALAVGWFLLTLVFGAIVAYVPDMRLILGGTQAGLFLIVQIVQYVFLTRAYRFPPQEVAVS